MKLQLIKFYVTVYVINACWDNYINTEKAKLLLVKNKNIERGNSSILIN